jgi:hypothetical protein
VAITTGFWIQFDVCFLNLMEMISYKHCRDGFYLTLPPNNTHMLKISASAVAENINANGKLLILDMNAARIHKQSSGVGGKRGKLLLTPQKC